MRRNLTLQKFMQIINQEILQTMQNNRHEINIWKIARKIDITTMQYVVQLFHFYFIFKIIYKQIIIHFCDDLFFALFTCIFSQ